MRVAALLFLLVSPFFLGARAEAAQCTPTRMGYNMGRETEYVISVPDEDMRRSQTWSPSDGAPPLAPWRAARLVRDWAAWTYAERGRVAIDVVELRKEFCHIDTGRWYYWVQFSIAVDDHACCAEDHHAFVLMNGRLYRPHKVSPSHPKFWD